MNINKINTLESPELEVYSSLKEVQLLRMYEPNPGIFIAESQIVIERAIEAGYEIESMLVEDKYIDKLPALIINAVKENPIYVTTYDILKNITGYEVTRGMLCCMKRKPLKSIEEICTNAKRIAILENVMNPTNVGAIFRSAAALKLDAVILTKGASDPLYRRALRVSMGNVFMIPWTITNEKDWTRETMTTLKQQGFKFAAMALKENTLSIADPILKQEEKLAIVLGTEGEGLKDTTINNCDYTVKIPMMEGVDSLNVSVASAIAFWELTKN